jgi:hypothetical protein
MTIQSTINPTQHLPPVAWMAPLGAPNDPPSGLGVDATSPRGAPPTTPGVVHANVGQKLLICYPLRVFSGDQ